MDNEHEWSDYPPGHVGPLNKPKDESEETKEDVDKDELDLENESVAGDDESVGSDDSSGISDVSGLIRKYSELKIKNLTFPEFRKFYGILHNCLSLLTDSDEEMQTITETIRACDRRRINSKSKSPIPENLPPVETFFAAKSAAQVYTDSNVAIASEKSSTCGTTSDDAVVIGYDPSKWFFKQQKNPTPFVPGVKVSHPFTDDIKSFLSEGDRKKLRELSVRHSFILGSILEG